MREFKRLLTISLSLMFVVWAIAGTIRWTTVEAGGNQPLEVRPPVVSADDGGIYMGQATESPKKKPPDTVTKGHDKRFAPQCPYTLLEDTSTCFRCHTFPTWKIKETNPDETRDYPNRRIRIRNETMYVELFGTVDVTMSDLVKDAFRYADDHPPISTVEFNILSSGGSLMIAWDIITNIEANKHKYMTRSTINGFGASAAFLIWCGPEERLAGRYSILMHHELWTFAMFQLDDPSSAEERARVLRLLQNNIHDYLITRGMLTKEELNAYVAGERDMWMTGVDAYKFKFATGLIG